MGSDTQPCGVNVAMAVFGSKWKPTILWLLGSEPLRFAELRRRVGGISEKVLTQQLGELQRDGVVRRTQRDGFPLHVEYALTARGQALDRALTPVAQWGDEHRPRGVLSS
ncbi:winged helix-turn-helix transcriptional regulator [Propionibacteriaceae bacterium Y1685]|uniref:winged helix-turn-helix transcriptional regulator n=1 Tax=Microlunatus sp. Y1700 TaxID=3418487 RepID=UPI003B760AB1